MRVLIVDDSRGMRKVIQRFLKEIDPSIDFVEAENGDEAMLKVQEGLYCEEKIDLIFLDWMMPGVTGFEFLQTLRAIEEFKDSPKVIMLTAETYVEQVEACLKYGITAYIKKPFTITDVEIAFRKVGGRDGV